MSRRCAAPAVTGADYASFHRRNVRHNSIVASATMQSPNTPTENSITHASTPSIPGSQSAFAMFGAYPMHYVTTSRARFNGVSGGVLLPRLRVNGVGFFRCSQPVNLGPARHEQELDTTFRPRQLSRPTGQTRGPASASFSGQNARTCRRPPPAPRLPERASALKRIRGHHWSCAAALLLSAVGHCA